MSEKSSKNIKNTCKTNIYKANSKKAQQVNPSPFKSAQVPWTYFFLVGGEGQKREIAIQWPSVPVLVARRGRQVRENKRGVVITSPPRGGITARRTKTGMGMESKGRLRSQSQHATHRRYLRTYGAGERWLWSAACVTQIPAMWI